MTPDELERFTRGEPVPVEVGAIERELDALWKQAGQKNGAVVSRAALWNIVMPARGRHALATAKQLVDDMASGMPTRAITLCLDDAPKSAAVEATIESNVVSQPGGAHLVYSEEITVTGPASAEGHFAALVRALLIAGVPTALFWIEPGLPLSFLKALLPMTSRLVTDTTFCARPQQLFALQQLVAHAQPLPIADIGWLRLGSVRAIFAGLFDPPVGGAPLAAATRVVVRHRPGCDASALLLVAWLGVKLDWRPLRSAQTSEGGLRLDFQRGDAPGDAIAVHMVPSEGACGKSGILGMELYVGSDRYAVSRTAIDQAAAEVPIAPAKLVKLDAHADAELCVDALGPRGRDPLFARVLALAGRLWAFEPAAAASRR